ncbi:transglutaminase domain-containing protein [Chryseolinea sp. H1M3-3]|uniref:transglutaminase-like domain-containing protein n=1 Tax=Chryseolinea sp. H1M3-3 TaxID=3034144 RepID=UPI0023EB0C15|nr:transglutaminase domain-containing protein [Chryseolinea sp. H1M3-3]
MKILIFLGLTLSTLAVAQDYPKLAEKYQQQYKDKEAVVLQSNIRYEYVKDAKVGAKITVSTNEKLLSLRYNSSIYRTQYYDQNSRVEKFFAESNLKQKVADYSKLCGSYTQDGLFYDDSKFCTVALKLKERGEVWDVTNVKKIDDVKYLTSVYFSENLPVQEKKISFVVPAEVTLDIKEFNLDRFSITKSEKTEANQKIIEYVVKDLRGLEKDSYDRGMQFSEPHLLILVKSMMVADKKVNVLATPQDLYAWYSSLTRQLKPNTQIFAPTVKELIKDKTTDEEKVKAIYYWVQDNVRYIAFEDGIAAFKPDEAHAVFEKRYGDCKGMANLMKEMLKVAGYDARLTWIGTRRILYDQSIPSLAVNNHMICTLLLNGKKFYLDATEKYIPFGQNAQRILDRPVMIEDGDKFIADKITETEKNRDIDSRKIKASIQGEDLRGKYVINLKGEAKKNFLYEYNYTKNDRKDEFMEDFISHGNKNVKTSNLKMPDLKERGGPLDLECDMLYTGAVSSFNNEYYIDIDPAKNFKDWIIADTRQSDIDFGERIYKKTSVELQIPTGFTVAHLPEQITVSEPEFSFNIQYKLAGNNIIYTKELKIPEGIINKNAFPRWNKAVKQLATAYENQIILKSK